MRDPRLPETIAGFEVGEDGVLSKNDMDCYPWYNKEGYIGGSVRYRLIAEEVSREEMFKTQENSE